MGQRTSKNAASRLYLPLFFNYRNHSKTTRLQEPIKFQYKLTKKKNTFSSLKDVLGGVKRECQKCTTTSTTEPTVYKSRDSDLHIEHGETSRWNRGRDSRLQKGPTRTNSEPNLRVRRRVRRMQEIRGRQNVVEQFGYEIQDVDAFLSKATLGKPANIPVVLALPSILYQTRVAGYQDEVALPLGMVVNAVFRNQNWLYVQTPHGEEGYVAHASCLPLGIIPPRDGEERPPCWERSMDVFPKPPASVSDAEMVRRKSQKEDEESYCASTRFRTALSTCGEKSVDRLYLRAAAMAKEKGIRHTLLVINEDYSSTKSHILSVNKNEVVFLLNASTSDWFHVKNKEGREGFIPSVIAGHGFL